MSPEVVVGLALGKLFGLRLIGVAGVALAGYWSASSAGWERVFWRSAVVFNVILVAFLWTASSIEAGDLKRALGL